MLFLELFKQLICIQVDKQAAKATDVHDSIDFNKIH